MNTVIDAHHHLWSLTEDNHDWLADDGLRPIRRDFTLAELTRLAAEAGVAASVLVQVLPDIEETRRFLALASSSALVAGVVGWVDLTSPTVAEDLAGLRGLGPLVGVRHLVQSEPDPDWLRRFDVLAGLRAVAAAGLTYDLLVLPHQLSAAHAAVRAVPELTFVLDHLAKPPIAAGELEPWATQLTALAAEPNVRAKLSGLVTEADHTSWTVAELRPYLDVALRAFGPERLMFGSDWPVCLLAAEYPQVLAAATTLLTALSPTERASIFHTTATRTYQLPW